MRVFVSEDGIKAFSEGMAFNRLERNIMFIRKKAIWAGRDPDLAEKLYRAKVLENQKQAKRS